MKWKKKRTEEEERKKHTNNTFKKRNKRERQIRKKNGAKENLIKMNTKTKYTHLTLTFLLCSVFFYLILNLFRMNTKLKKKWILREKKKQKRNEWDNEIDGNRHTFIRLLLGKCCIIGSNDVCAMPGHDLHKYNYSLFILSPVLFVTLYALKMNDQ